MYKRFRKEKFLISLSARISESFILVSILLFFKCSDPLAFLLEDTNPDPTSPDLTVEIMPASATVESSGMLTLTATVRNTGRRASSAITLRWYSSLDAAVDTGDTQLGNDVSVDSLAAGAGSSSVSNTITVSSDSGTYHYGACVVQTPPNEMDESDTANNCFTVPVTVTVAPDLVVGVSAASTSVVTSAMFTLTATVENEGTGATEATTDLTWYRSDDDDLDTDTDTLLETQEDEVDILARVGNAGDSETISYTATAPMTTGTYHYFACAAAVTDESNTMNNCSSGAEVVVTTRPPFDLTLSVTRATSTNVAASEMTTLTAVVRNAGANPSPATYLQWYRSTDNSITTADTQEGSDVGVDALAANTVSEAVSGTITVPMTVGTYYYGACVVTATSESNTMNNCSSGVAVVVSAPGGGTRLSAIEITAVDGAENERPLDIWSDETTLWVLDFEDTYIYAYNLATGARDSAKEFDLHTDNAAPRGIWSNGITLWVSDSLADKLFAYTLDNGNRNSSQDITLSTAMGDNNGFAGSIWSDKTTIWVADGAQDKLFAYTLGNGNRNSSQDFGLSPLNSDIAGIWSDGVTLWVADHGDDKVYAYKRSDKNRNSTKEFDLSAGNSDARGIWSDGATMWVGNIEERTDGTDDMAENIYAYDIRSLVTP